VGVCEAVLSRGSDVRLCPVHRENGHDPEFTQRAEPDVTFWAAAREELVSELVHVVKPWLLAHCLRGERYDRLWSWFFAATNHEQNEKAND